MSIRLFASTAFIICAVFVSLLVLVISAGVQLVPPVFTPPEREDRIITDVTIVRPGRTRLLHHSIVIKDGLITDVRPVHPDDPKPVCQDCFVMPGLIDAHVHTPPEVVAGNQALFALMYLARGVTSVRDVGQSEPAVKQLAMRLNTGLQVGPRMYRCGPVIDGSPPGWPVAKVVETYKQGISMVESLAADDVDWIKVYNELNPDAFRGIAKAASVFGLPLIGHVPHDVGMANVADFEAQHLTGFPYLAQPRPPVGWGIRTQDILAMTEDEIDEAVLAARTRNISLTPTLANFRQRLIASDSSVFPPTPGARFLPALWATGWDFVAGHPEGEVDIQRQIDSLPFMAGLVKRAHGSGVDILAGTDTLMPWVIPGESLLGEILELEVALGSRELALIAATRTNGKHIDRGAIGIIETGAKADLLMLENDPIVDLTALSNWRYLTVDGRLYSRSQVNQWLTIYRIHFHDAFYEQVMNNLIGVIARAYGSV